MKIKISAGAERDIADGCDFYREIDPNLAVYFHDSISGPIQEVVRDASQSKSEQIVPDHLEYTFRR